MIAFGLLDIWAAESWRGAGGMGGGGEMGRSARRGEGDQGRFRARSM